MTSDAKFLAGKVALVTGSSRGTGAEIARTLGRAGARVAVHYNTASSRAQEVVRGIRDDGTDADAFQGNLAEGSQVRTLVEEVVKRLGPVSVLVNNAGPFSDTPFRQLPETEWDHIMNTNLKAAYLTTQFVAEGMTAAGWGRVINIGATSGLVRSHAVYGLAKAALLHLTESLALELAPAITVNAVVPSQIAGEETDRMPEYKRQAIAATPLGRLVTREEIAQMVLLLCSPAFDFVTGRPIILDGGRSIPVFPQLHLPPDQGA